MSAPPSTAAALLAVALGSALGGCLRWAAGAALNGVWLAGFPLGTLAVNCIGGLFIGALMFWFTLQPHELWRTFLITGVLGGLTTFSAFTGESLALLHHGRVWMALSHTLAHVAGALACAAAGYALARLAAGGLTGV